MLKYIWHFTHLFVSLHDFIVYMRVRYIYMRVWTLLCLCGLFVTAQAQRDSIVASLLTCSPGTQVYSLYGHTGLRMRNVTQGTDYVFNYGVFDFRRPHFAWHFTLGECDYQVVGVPYGYFIDDYVRRGSRVTEQELALNGEEAYRLMAALVVNCLPENRTYRYNFLTNNCTTRVRDQIEAAVDGDVVYVEAEDHPTFRQLLHHYTEGYDWAETGNDLLLGASSDRVTSDRQAQFLPEQLMNYMETAQVYDSLNNRHPLLRESRILVEGHPQTHEEPFPLTPFQVGLAFVALMVAIALIERWAGHMCWLVDMLLMTLQGLAGILVCLMFFFSAHPTVDTNWHVWLLNPLPLLCMPWVVRRAIQHRVCVYHYLNLLVLTLFLVFIPWIPQSFPVLTPCLALGLLTRPVSYYLHYRDGVVTELDRR